MPTTAKICGLSTPGTLDAAVSGGASHVGLNFFSASPRHVGFEQATGLAARTPSHVALVGIFVDPADELLDHAIAAGRLDAIQLHDTAPDRTAAVRARTRLEMWAAIPVRTRADLDGARRYAQAADRLGKASGKPNTSASAG